MKHAPKKTITVLPNMVSKLTSVMNVKPSGKIGILSPAQEQDTAKATTEIQLQKASSKKSHGRKIISQE